MKWFRRSLLWFLCINLAQATPRTASHLKIEEPEIPKKTEIPQRIDAPSPPELFNCDRRIIYQGKALNCDSYTQRDGEKLRPILKEVPEALSELDLYQKERRSLKPAAYIGTIGLLASILGFIAKGQFGPGTSDTARTLGDAAAYGGLVILGGSITYGFFTYQVSENRFEHSIDLYNKARPNDAIQLQFSTGFQFY